MIAVFIGLVILCVAVIAFAVVAMALYAVDGFNNTRGR